MRKIDRAITDEDLIPGCVILLPMTNEDENFKVKKTLNNSADKFNVIVGLKDDCFSVATVLINTNEKNETVEIQDVQFPLEFKDYPAFLTHKSFIDCSLLREISKERLKKEGRFRGHLSVRDLALITHTIEHTRLISTKVKKSYGIENKAQ